jgi:hypothetical protein
MDKCTSIFILRQHNCGLHSTGIFRQRTMNSCGYQRQNLRREGLKILGCRWLEPQAIGGEDKLLVNGIKHFHSHEPRLLILNDLGEICIVKQELLNMDPKLSLRAQIQLVTPDNSWTCPICQPSSNGTYLQFQLCRIWAVVNIVNLIEEH